MSLKIRSTSYLMIAFVDIFFFNYNLQVPAGHVWLEGDNLENSCDSRDFGPVPQGLIRGRVICKVWPPNDVTMLTVKSHT